MDIFKYADDMNLWTCSDYHDHNTDVIYACSDSLDGIYIPIYRIGEDGYNFSGYTKRDTNTSPEGFDDKINIKNDIIAYANENGIIESLIEYVDGHNYYCNTRKNICFKLKS